MMPMMMVNSGLKHFNCCIETKNSQVIKFVSISSYHAYDLCMVDSRWWIKSKNVYVQLSQKIIYLIVNYNFRAIRSNEERRRNCHLGESLAQCPQSR